MMTNKIDNFKSSQSRNISFMSVTVIITTQTKNNNYKFHQLPHDTPDESNMVTALNGLLLKGPKTADAVADDRHMLKTSSTTTVDAYLPFVAQPMGLAVTVVAVDNTSFYSC